VLEPGVVRPGDRITFDHRPDHEVSIGGPGTGLSPARAQQLLHSGAALTTALRGKARTYAARLSTAC
jgi:MOSC domain-containing protein YiiM